MTAKSDLVSKISADLNITKKLTKEVIDLFLEEMKTSIIDDGEVMLKDFGIFKVKHIRERTVTNPRTREPMDLPQTNAVSFKPYKQFKEKLNHPSPI